MSAYIDQYASLFSQLERMGKDAAIPESHKAPMLLAPINLDSVLEFTAAVLRTKEVSELTWDFVATTLIDEYNARQSPAPVRQSRRKKRNGNTKDPIGSDFENTVEEFAAAMRGRTPRGTKCDFFDRIGHTANRCFLNPDNPNNRCLLYTSPSPRDQRGSRMPSSA